MTSSFMNITKALYSYTCEIYRDIYIQILMDDLLKTSILINF